MTSQRKTLARTCIHRTTINWFFLYLLLFSSLLLLSSTTDAYQTSSSAQRKDCQNQKKGKTSYLDELNGSKLTEALSKMTMKELEEVCSQRGFELITDEIDATSGYPVVYTHVHYREAAWQCVTMATVTEQLTSYNDDLTNDEIADASSSRGGPFWFRVLKRVLGDNVLIRFIKKISNHCRIALEGVRREAISDSRTTTENTAVVMTLD